MDRYAMYLRKSRADLEAEKLGEGETLARHKKILTELAARKGLYVEKIYQEIVSGAEAIKDRPEIKQLIEDCYKGMYRGIIIIEVTRLSRGSQGDAQIIMDCLKYANKNQGMLVITPTKVYDVAHNHDDEEYMEFELFMSRREYKMIKRRMDRGKNQAVVEGNFMAAYRPYGWDILKTKMSRTLVPNPEEHPILQQMYEWADPVGMNMTPGAIGRKLTAMGVPTYTGEKEWSTASIKSILANPVNIGKVRWNDRMQVKTMVDGELVTTRPRSSHTDHYMLYDGKHNPAVDPELFERVNNKFHTDKTKADLKLQNPLAGIFVCANCGKVMIYQQYKNRPGTAPRFLHKQSQLCKVKSVLASDVFNAVIHSLKLYIEDYSLKVDNLPDVDENTIMKQMDVLKAEMRKIEKKLEKVFDDYENEIYTANEFVARKAKHNERIESIKKQMADLEDSIPEKEAYQETIMKLSDALDAIQDEDLDAEVRNTYLREIIEKIEYSRENDDEFIIDVHPRR